LKDIKAKAMRTAERLEIPHEVFGGTRITITGERRLLIEKHRGILEYGRELITVNCGRRIVEVYGSQLDLVTMTAEALLITGELSRIEFGG